MFRAVLNNNCKKTLTDYVFPKAVQHKSISVTSVQAQRSYDDDDENMRIVRRGKDYNQADTETCMLYMKSEAYKKTYGDDVVWRHYRRNFRGTMPPKTRLTCVRMGKVSAGTPCPVCRDEYLNLNYQNTELLEQFLDPITGESLPTKKTGLCQKQQKNLNFEVAKAQDYGYLEKYFPLREYNYAEYYKLAGLTNEGKTTKEEKSNEENEKR